MEVKGGRGGEEGEKERKKDRDIIEKLIYSSRKNIAISF